jgi:hypothetical protein
MGVSTVSQFVLFILRLGTPAQVAGRIVDLDVVVVTRLRASWSRAVECQRHELVNLPRSLKNRNLEIPVSVWTRF